MNLTGQHQRVLQVHPSLRCNLKCLHCYSSSGPRAAQELDPALVQNALSDAAALGYNVASFSGGEPLLYRALPEVLRHAKKNGMLTTLTTNGILLDRRRIAPLREVLDLLAISIDGAPASHNKLRNFGLAFQAMRDQLPNVREAGIRFGFLFTLTHENAGELDWAADFAYQEGAHSFQIHPLEEAGRAESLMRGKSPNDAGMTLAWLKAHQLNQKYAGRMNVHCDLAHRDQLAQHGSLAREFPNCLADIVSPLVIESDGTVVPAQYGFPRQYALGNLHNRPLTQLAGAWMAEPASRFLSVCDQTMALLTEDTEHVSEDAELPFVNWYEKLAMQASALTSQ